MLTSALRICLDLDGVICELRRPGQDYADLAPVPGAVEGIRALRASGHQIIIHTARHMKTTAGNPGLALARKGLVTLEWLTQHGIEFDEIHFGKPYAHLYIDDNAVRFNSWAAIVPGRLPLNREEHALRRQESPDIPAPSPLCAIVALAGVGSRFRGSRFQNRDGSPPKPLVDVAGKPMVWWALRSLLGISISRLVFVVLEEHDRSYGLSEELPRIAASCFAGSAHQPETVHVVVQRGRLPGQLCSVLEARDLIDPDVPVSVSSADTYVVSDFARRLSRKEPECRGLISVANLPGDRWSFARTDASGTVLEVAEKRRISDHASTGLYWFASGREFLNAADASVRLGVKVAGEHYVMPTYSSLLAMGKRVEIAPADAVWDMGTPETLDRFLGHLRECCMAHEQR